MQFEYVEGSFSLHTKNSVYIPHFDYFLVLFRLVSITILGTIQKIPLKRKVNKLTLIYSVNKLTETET